MYTIIRKRFSPLNSYSQVGYWGERLITQLLNLHYFSLKSEQLSSYSHSWRAGAREDTVRKVCVGLHRIQISAKRDRRRFHGSHRTHQAKRYSPLNKKTRICLVPVHSTKQRIRAA